MYITHCMYIYIYTQGEKRYRNVHVFQYRAALMPLCAVRQPACGWSFSVFGVIWLVSLCSCGATTGLLVSWFSKPHASKANQSETSQQSWTACYSALPVVRPPIIVLSWHVQDRESVIARVWETSSRQQWLQRSSLPAAACPVICYRRSSVFPSQLIKNWNLFHKALLPVLSWAGRGEEKRRKEKIRKMEKKVVNVTEPWKAWPGVGMIRYTRFFSAVAAGINITYISPLLVQEISSPGTYNLNTLTALWFTHTAHTHTCTQYDPDSFK